MPMLAGNLFLVGRTKSGKTTIAARLATDLGLTHVAASAWAREGFGEVGSGEDFTRRITAWSLAKLHEDPDVCVRFVRARHELARGGHVIEGVRNPRDLVLLHDPTHDAIAWIDSARVPAAVTPFERGVEIICAYAAWLEDTELAPPGRFARIPLADDEPIDAAVARVRAFLEGMS
jgi:hypothetical protein